MAIRQYDYGMIGLGTMGRNLAYNMNDHGYSVAGFDKDLKQVALFNEGGKENPAWGTADLEKFMDSLKSPKTILLLVPAGKIVDIVIEELKPLLAENDLVIDCGNSHFTDTDRRIEYLSKQKIHFMGVGVSGGEEGARFGPSIMPGGALEAYTRIATMLQSISAKVNNEPCVSYIGPGSAGHYVKMVHNGIEYALMQLIAETYHLLKEVGGLSNSELHQVFSGWNEGRLQSFLIEISAQIFLKRDELSNNDLLDVIADAAHQKGTGKWTSQSAMDLQVPVPVIDIAVAARELSAYREERKTAARKIKSGAGKDKGNKNLLIANAEQALYFSTIIAYAQGMSLLRSASTELKYNLDLAGIAALWRGGCIIRAGLLENIRNAYAGQMDLANLLLNDFFAKELIDAEQGIREIVCNGASYGIPLLAMMSSLGYYDTYRRDWLPTNLIQAQRDFFGAHTYKRTDREGVFHTKWN